jgi:diguanylate cyclase (GGDEF)-like protein/PAS domain S-box-containing protein
VPVVRLPAVSLLASLPHGRSLPDALWWARHRALLRLLGGHVLLLPAWALVNGHDLGHAVNASVALAVVCLVAARTARRSLASASVALGLVVASALVVHLGGGHTFLHFHVFVVVAALALYQDWLPFCLALSFVLVEHAVLGVWETHEVYSDPWSRQHPVAAAALHAGYVLVAATANVVTWGWSQREREAAEQRADVEARRVHDSERRLAELIDNAPAMVFVKDLEGRLVRVNPTFAAMHGKTPADLLGKTSGELFGYPAVDGLLDSDVDALQGAGVIESEREIRFPTGTRTMHVTKFPLLDADGRPYAIAGICTDTTRRAAAERDLMHQSRHDALTGLPNRTALHERLAEALAHEGLVGVLFIDLDGFKEVNDSLGHDAGDALLEAVAARLRGGCREGELLARLGGDEFVVCLSRLHHVSEAESAAGRMLAALEEPMVLEGRLVEVSGSCGVAVGRSADGATPGLLLRDADTALYEAKSAGRARLVTFEPALRERDERRRRLQVDLAEALRTGAGLSLVYQPIADASTGELVLAEALLRWQHPVDGALSPGDFLGLAADRGLLPDLDRWVVGRACAQAAEWQRAGLTLAVSVNVTPGSVEDGAVVTWVRHACSATGVDPGRLVIELTETAVVERPQETSAALAALRTMGVRIALDDFGTGYSSMSHLRDLPVDIVKIDRSFTAGTVRSAREAAIVEATTRLAVALGATTIAEGVETAGEQAAVVAAGCAMLQGWHIARPLEPAALAVLMAGGLPVPRTALVSVKREQSA